MTITSLNSLPTKCMVDILKYVSPRDTVVVSQVSKDLEKIADSNSVWDDYLKEGYKSFQTGESAKDTFRDNLFAIHSNYLTLHPERKKIYNELLELLSRDEEYSASLLKISACEDPKKAAIILNDCAFYNFILLSFSSASYLSAIAQSHVDAAVTILNEEKFYREILRSSSSSHNQLSAIAKSHPNAATIILNEEKFYREILKSSSLCNHQLSAIAQSHPDAAAIILNQEKFYTPILAARTFASEHLLFIAQSDIKSALIILSEEKFYSKITPTIHGKVFELINTCYLGEEAVYKDRETLLENLRRIQVSNAVDIRTIV